MQKVYSTEPPVHEKGGGVVTSLFANIKSLRQQSKYKQTSYAGSHGWRHNHVTPAPF